MRSGWFAVWFNVVFIAWNVIWFAVTPYPPLQVLFLACACVQAYFLSLAIRHVKRRRSR